FKILFNIKLSHIQITQNITGSEYFKNKFLQIDIFSKYFKHKNQRQVMRFQVKKKNLYDDEKIIKLLRNLQKFYKKSLKLKVYQKFTIFIYFKVINFQFFITSSIHISLRLKILNLYKISIINQYNVRILFINGLQGINTQNIQKNKNVQQITILFKCYKIVLYCQIV
ncbi:hypothetical protein IMG5_143350, partial [Ichthyophthirius multifiliis]